MNIDCPDDAESSPSALVLPSVLESHGLADASAVLRSYGFACWRFLDAADATVTIDAAYRGWLEAHAVRWTTLANECEAKLSLSAGGISSSYTICLSMFYNWIDSEAATTGIWLNGGGGMARLVDAIEELEPGYAAQRDTHEKVRRNCILLNNVDWCF
jgi:hypothetical protein